MRQMSAARPMPSTTPCLAGFARDELSARATPEPTSEQGSPGAALRLR